MFCQNCGSQVNDNVQICPFCGQNTNLEIPPNQGNHGYGYQQPYIENYNQGAYQQQQYQQQVNQGGYQQQPYQQSNQIGYQGAYQQSVQPQKKGKPIAIVAVALAAVIGVGAFGGYMLLGDEGDEAESAESIDDKGGKKITATNADGELDDEAVDELISYINGSINLLDDALDELDGDDLYTDAQLLDGLYDDLCDYQTKASGLSGLDSNIVEASDEFFNLITDSTKSYYDNMQFCYEFIDYMSADFSYIPQLDDYDSIEDYYNELYDWYGTAKDGYASISSYPLSYTDEMEKFDGLLDYSYDIVLKALYADEYDDMLRKYSASFMANRFETMLDAQFDSILDCLYKEMDFFYAQFDVCGDLAAEIYDYADMSANDRKKYEFKNIFTNEVSLEYDAVDTIYPTLYSTYDAFVILNAGCLSGSNSIVVEAEIPEFTQKYTETFNVDSSMRTIYIKPPILSSGDTTSAKSAQINITVSLKDGTLLESKSFPVTVKSKYDFDWYTDDYGIATRDNILCYLTPESSGISQLKRTAIDELETMTDGDIESFVGYQQYFSDDDIFTEYATSYLQAAGLMLALYDSGVRYNADTFSISGSNQHILFPDDVLEQKSGLCIETTLVVASALQSAGMHVMLIFPPGHAQVALETWEGSGRYFLIETTSLSDSAQDADTYLEQVYYLMMDGTGPSGVIEYMDNDRWLEYLSVDGTYLVDCDDIASLGTAAYSN